MLETRHRKDELQDSELVAVVGSCGREVSPPTSLSIFSYRSISFSHLEDDLLCLPFEFFIIAWVLLEGINEEMLCICIGDLFLTIA